MQAEAVAVGVVFEEEGTEVAFLTALAYPFHCNLGHWLLSISTIA